MKNIEIYLTFDGQCEAAFTFYEKVLRGKIQMMGRYHEIPSEQGFSFPEDQKNRIMHTSLAIGDYVLLGSDTGGEGIKHFKQGNNFSISLNPDSREEADRIFAELSEGGQVIMPMSDTFWEAYFGSFIDRFGVGWMINYK